jgi:transposase
MPSAPCGGVGSPGDPCPMSCRHPRFPIRENDRTRAIRGSDGAKTLSGRKRHLLGASGGLVLRAVVHPADVADRDGTPAVWADLPPTGPALRQVWVDMGSQGRLVTWLAETLEVTRAVVQRPRRWVRVPVDPDPPMPSPRPVQPRRGVVDRSFAWLDRYRRLGTDDEQFAATEEAGISPAMTQLMAHRLAQGPPFQTPSKRLHRRC